MASVVQIETALKQNLNRLQAIQYVTSAGQKHVFKAQYDGIAIALKVIFVGIQGGDGEPESEQADDVTANAARLQREIEILSKCNCRNIITLSAPEYFEFTIDRERFAAYGETWIDGDDLRKLFNARQLTRAEAIELGLAMCNAIEDLDNHGYVHRDVKPQNIMLRNDGTFILVDPGMALDRAGRSLTQAGSVLGTVDYMSPEQWDPQRKRDLDVRTDMFGLGVVLFRGLSGRHPFAEEGMNYIGIMTASRSKKRRDLVNEEIPADDPLRTIIARLLSPSPHGRYRDTAALRDAFEAAR